MFWILHLYSRERERGGSFFRLLLFIFWGPWIGYVADYEAGGARSELVAVLLDDIWLVYHMKPAPFACYSYMICTTHRSSNCGVTVIYCHVRVKCVCGERTDLVHRLGLRRLQPKVSCIQIHDRV